MEVDKLSYIQSSVKKEFCTLDPYLFIIEKRYSSLKFLSEHVNTSLATIY